MRVNRRRLMVASDIAKLEEIQQSPNSNVGDRDLQAIVDPMGDSRFCIDGIHLLLCTSNVETEIFRLSSILWEIRGFASMASIYCCVPFAQVITIHLF
jgi:hypothetical protein